MSIEKQEEHRNRRSYGYAQEAIGRYVRKAYGGLQMKYDGRAIRVKDECRRKRKERKNTGKRRR